MLQVVAEHPKLHGLLQHSDMASPHAATSQATCLATARAYQVSLLAQAAVRDLAAHQKGKKQQNQLFTVSKD